MAVLPTHPLIGKLLWLGDDDPALFSVSQFTSDLGKGLILARRLDPFTGKPLPASHIINLELIAGHPEAEVFDDWQSLARAAEPPKDEDEPVLRLVPRRVPHQGNS